MVRRRVRERSYYVAMAAYLGLAPVVWHYAIRHRDAYVKLHATRALVLSHLLLLRGLLFIAACVPSAAADLLSSAVFRCPAAMWLAYLTARLAHYVWLVAVTLWAVSLVLAAGGSTIKIPRMRRISRSRRVLRTALLAWYGAYATILVIAPVAMHASSLTSHSRPDAEVHLLYDDRDKFPQWIFNLSFYRVARAAQRHFGAGATVVAPLDERSLARAAKHGRLIVIASHGLEHGIFTTYRSFTPEDVPTNTTSVRPRLVYITACYSDCLAADWQAAFNASEIMTQRARVTVVRHFLWLWFRAPGLVDSL